MTVLRRIRHLNVGSFQLLWWPRRRLWFWRGSRHYFTYRWILYVWPFEVRRFRETHRFRRRAS